MRSAIVVLLVLLGISAVLSAPTAKTTKKEQLKKLLTRFFDDDDDWSSESSSEEWKRKLPASKKAQLKKKLANRFFDDDNEECLLLHVDDICDGWIDCEDGSDEIFCDDKKRGLKTKTNKKSILKKLKTRFLDDDSSEECIYEEDDICDGWIDCEDGIDELFCDKKKALKSKKTTKTIKK